MYSGKMPDPKWFVLNLAKHGFTRKKIVQTLRRIGYSNSGAGRIILNATRDSRFLEFDTQARNKAFNLLRPSNKMRGKKRLGTG